MNGLCNKGYTRDGSMVVLREDGEGGVNLKWGKEEYETSLDKS